MPSTSTLIAFALASIVLVVVPGPSVLFIVGRALAHGRRAAIQSVFGNLGGVLVLIAVVAVGLGPLAERSVVVYEVIKLAGAAYLVWLGVRTFRGRRELAAALSTVAGEASTTDRRFLRQGFLVGVTNPKALVFFAAVLPQFADPAKGSVPVQIVVLGVLFCVLATALDGCWGLAASAARSWFATSPARLAAVGGTGGLMIAGMGLGLAVTGRRD
ncbi:LysE family translocator [Pseudonocardia endophytica]|uniref:Threonine/homoserine/homoserine lactone efflux protein n=1 Tax=Pseudonocardia endophytica TaxID=401976 RepID=A0A4R1HHJ0_PSEEN|nr:LysE family translocator [Pseudonocardia endophytica]TCK21687.1 threonine/homoserine/homoserine lactone efflux protein [Pseudonocardia endophytica]